MKMAWLAMLTFVVLRTASIDPGRNVLRLPLPLGVQLVGGYIDAVCA